MPNSDNTYGTFNKQTKIISQGGDSAGWTTFADINEAKAFFFTNDALTVMDECCTILQWALIADDDDKNTKLKTTFAFGTKGNSDIAEADDWAGQYNSRKSALIDSNEWTKANCTFASSDDHLV